MRYRCKDFFQVLVVVLLKGVYDEVLQHIQLEFAGQNANLTKVFDMLGFIRSSHRQLLTIKILQYSTEHRRILEREIDTQCLVAIVSVL
jgi:hypothetical protein